jgi:hypothetical protein
LWFVSYGGAGCAADIARSAAWVQWGFLLQEDPMTQQAVIRGDVSFRAGDGVLMPIPDGPVEIELSHDSATLSWTEDDGSREATAIPLDEYERYVNEGKIRVAP